MKVYFIPALRLFYLQELPSPIIRFHEGIDYFRTPPSISYKSLAPAIAARAPPGNASPSEGRPLRFLSDGTGMGASLNLPDGHLAPKGIYSRFSANAYRGARQGTREPCGMVNSRALCIVLWSVVCLGGVSAVPERIRHPFLTCKPSLTPNSGELHTNPSPIPSHLFPYLRGLACYL